MTQSLKTLIFVIAAAASVGIAAGTYYSNKPADIADFSDVGDKFYPKFDDPSSATALRVAAYNDATGKTEVFKVENKDGLWQIPSHNNYPADGKELLSKIAASMIGVTREALVERTKQAQKRYDVLDPLDEEQTGEGRGDRITLYNGDEVLVDFIVGKKIPDSDTTYYVRRADEDRFYTADLGNFRVSTKFSEWIEKDILDVDADSVKEVVISRYSVDEAQGRVVPEGVYDLKRENQNSPWGMPDLDTKKEKVNEANIGTLLRSLRDLKIVGVRKKPEALIAGLKGTNGGIAIDPFVRRDLQQKGVFINQAGGQFVYNEGKVNIGTDSGILYELGFGEEFSGSDVEIEVGGESSPAEEARKLENADEAADKDSENKESEAKPDQGEKPGQKKSRYLFVMAYFDKSLLGPEPVAPTAPEKPQVEDKSAEKDKGADADKPAAAEKKADADPPAEEKATEEKKPEESKPDPQKAYEEALKEYELQKEVYEAKKKKYEEDLKAGEKKVAELNARFADWYYVISEDAFEKLKLKREDLVEEVKPEETANQPEAAQPKEEKAEAGQPAAMEKPAEKADASESVKQEKPASQGEPEKKEPEKKEPEKKEPEKKESDSAPAPAGEASAKETPIEASGAGESAADSAPSSN